MPVDLQAFFPEPIGTITRTLRRFSVSGFAWCSADRTGTTGPSLRAACWLASEGNRRSVHRRTAGKYAGMDDRVAHFFVSVGRLCGDARVGGLVVRLTLMSGEEVIGVPAPPRETEGTDELDGTGYADTLTVDGVAVPLSDVVAASVGHPELPAVPD